MKAEDISTIVEIHLAYQPMPLFCCHLPLIYNSRNSFGLLAYVLRCKSRDDLQQQKFIWLISHKTFNFAFCLSTIVEIHLAYQPEEDYKSEYQIYNSRNSFGLLARPVTALSSLTIYNSRNSFGLLASMVRTDGFTNLQQQKFIWLISPTNIRSCGQFIYNSRNSFGLLATMFFCFTSFTSTIVEIHLAYQPYRTKRWRVDIYNSRNSFGLLAYLKKMFGVQESTIVEIHLAYQPIFVS